MCWVFKSGFTETVGENTIFHFTPEYREVLPHDPQCEIFPQTGIPGEGLMSTWAPLQ